MFEFHILVHKQDNDVYIAHCLELDLVAEADTAETACDELQDIIDTQIRTCIENDNLENLFFPAPPEVWAKFGRAQVEGKPERVKRELKASNTNIELQQTCYA